MKVLERLRNRCGIHVTALCLLLLASAGQCVFAKSLVLDGVAARVDDRPILVSDVQKVVAPLYPKLRQTYKGAELEEQLKNAYDEALQLLIDREVILARHENPNPQGIELLVEERLDELIRVKFDGNRSAFISALSAERTSLDEWKQEVRNRLIVTVIQQQMIGGHVSVSPGQVWEAYSGDIERFRQSEKVHMRMIVLQKGGSQQDTALKREQAHSLRTRIVAGGDFAALAESFSEDIKSDKGGDWGWIETSALKPELAAAVSKLDAGGVSEVIEDSNSLYVLKVEGRKESKIIPIDEAWDDLVREIEKEEYARLYETWIERLREKSYIRVYEM